MVDHDFVALDCEMTGFSPETDKIIEVGATRFTLEKNGVDFDELINPGVRLPAVIVRLTGIRDEELAVAAPFVEKKEAIENITKDATIIGHNIRFDLAFLRTHGLDITTAAQFDTYDLASLVTTRGPSLSLIGLAAHFGITHDDAHRALADAAATRELFRALIAVGQTFERTKWETIAQLRMTSATWLTRFARLILDTPTMPSRDVKNKSSSFSKGGVDPDASGETEDFLHSSLADLIIADGQSLLETTASIGALIDALSSIDTRPVLLSCAGQFEARETAARTGLPLVFAPRHYADPTRIKAFLTRELSPIEAVFAAKLILHADAPFFSFNFNRAEQLLWDFVAADHLPENVRADINATPIALTYHGTLPALADDEDITRRTIIATSATYLPTALSRVDAITLDLPALETLVPAQTDTLAMWWGLLGMLYREGSTNFKDQQVFIDDVRHLPTATRMIAAGMSFVEAARDRLPTALTRTIETYLADTPGFVRGLRTDSGGNLTIACDPLPDPLVAKQLITHLPHVIFVDSALVIDGDAAYARPLLGLSDDTRIVAIPMPEPRPTLATIPHLPEPYGKNTAREVEAALIDLANTLPGITTIVFAGRYQLGTFFEYAQTRVTRPLLAEKLSGSQSKIELLLREHETAVYLTSSTLILAPRTRNLIVVKLPFDRTPTDSELTKQLLSFKKMYASLAGVRDRPNEQQLIVLDTRIVNAAVGKKFARAIECEVVGM